MIGFGGISMQIRDAANGDIAALRAIMNYYREYSSYLWEKKLLTDADVQAWLDEHSVLPYAALVAEENGKVIGFASLSCFRAYSGYCKTAENSIYLSPELTDRGYGGALMCALLMRALQNGLRVITAWIDSENQKSIRFHERFGFRQTGFMQSVGTLENEPRSIVIMQYMTGVS